MKPKLYLIPSPLGNEAVQTLSPQIPKALSHIRFFIVERSRTARRFIKSILPQVDINSMTFYELDKHQPEYLPETWFQPLEYGHDMGLLSEAGCPGVADPGAFAVRKAHELGIQVQPLTGPSSLLLALMASGLNGQNFAFVGYLPVKKQARIKKLRELEQKALKTRQTQIFIETPYRNQQLLEAILQNLRADTLLCLATDLTLPTEFIRTYPIAHWRKLPSPFEDKRPAVFLIGK